MLESNVQGKRSRYVLVKQHFCSYCAADVLKQVIDTSANRKPPVK